MANKKTNKTVKKDTVVEPEIVETEITEPTNVETVIEETSDNKSEPTVETVKVDNKDDKNSKEKKSYVVALGTPSFYVIQLEDGTFKTLQGSNNYKRGDIVQL